MDRYCLRLRVERTARGGHGGVPGDVGGAGVQPNELTVSSVLPVCVAVGAMELGMKVEEYARGKGHLRNVFVTNALLEMYAKCGSIQRAWQGTPSYAQFMYGDADSKFAPSVKGVAATAHFNDLHHIIP
ncbi:pentatricopeptide repeat-containing protein [Hordeum vulgare]|nr:pentatricopeptide repeat-containing protein [Hordeum vulgare]